ncbi:hypothetical protein FA95DRAFT_313535 [Auriscalpium vulgare]|uniref:Uncharacterized protein n=1 Tax=Auriscalpium vulgare TaxID=40419 RepID=A0ACB8S571_9AGAM|nr:hypothetical protein FA95DRAFT_313535 [Auriscalpium vulgare]
MRTLSCVNASGASVKSSSPSSNSSAPWITVSRPTLRLPASCGAPSDSLCRSVQVLHSLPMCVDLHVSQAIRNLSVYFDKIGQILEEIAEELPHYQDYAAALFPNSQRVMEGLAAVYGDILKTCTTVRRIYQNPKGERSKRSSFSIHSRAMNIWDRALDDIIDSLRQRRERLNGRVRHEALRLDHEQRHMNAAAQRQREDDERQRESQREEKEQRLLAEAAEARERDRLRQMDQRKKEFLADLKQSAYAECHSKHEACRSVLSQHLDAGRWLLDRPEFQDWADSSVSSSGMLWLRGKAGAGKTILASQFDAAPKRRNIAYFYCQYDDAQKRSDPRIVLGTLLHQVISQLPSDDPYMPKLGPSGSTPPDHDALLAMLSSIAKNSENIVLVVDALDEFDANRRRKLLQALKRLSRDAKVFLTSRDLMPSHVQDDTRDLLRDVQVIPADPEYVNRDIMMFVDRNVRFDGEDDSDVLNDPEAPLKVRSLALRDEIRRVLVQRADGMFLYVRLQLLYLRKQATEHDIRSALRSLPDGMNKTFIRALQDIEALPQKRRDRVRRLFRWLVCSPNPPFLEDIAHAVVVDDMDEIWDASRCITKPYTLIEDSANLVEAPYSASVQFIHASIKEFLCSEISLHEEGPLPAYHSYPLSAAHETLVLTAFKYYSLTTELSSRWSSWYCDIWVALLRKAGKDGVSLISHIRRFLDPTSSTRAVWLQRYKEWAKFHCVSGGRQAYWKQHPLACSTPPAA